MPVAYIVQERKPRPEAKDCSAFKMKQLGLQPKGLTAESACPGLEGPREVQGELEWGRVYKVNIGQCLLAAGLCGSYSLLLCPVNTRQRGR